MPTIVLATCLEQPELTPSDALLADALQAEGFSPIASPWNGAYGPFANADMVIIRSTWDYFGVPNEFADWLDRLAARGKVYNSPALMRWNMGKTYLFELAKVGVRMAPLRLIDPDARAIGDAMDALGLDSAIVKPVVGGTASGLSKVRRDKQTALEVAAARLGGPGLVQAFVPEITTVGETSLIFLAGQFSHAVVKRPKAGDIRVQEDHGGVSSPVTPAGWAIAEASRILTMFPESPLYARIDAVILDNQMLLMEAELVEPELFFTYCPDGARRLAAALRDELK